MKEPILSREQVYEEMTKRDPYWNAYGASRGVAVDLAIKCALAILEKLCGEPIYQSRHLSDEPDRWDDVYADTHSDCASQPQFYDTRIVYALNRSKA